MVPLETEHLCHLGLESVLHLVSCEVSREEGGTVTKLVGFLGKNL